MIYGKEIRDNERKKSESKKNADKERESAREQEKEGERKCSQFRHEFSKTN